jgi:hypothetical protein
VIGGSFLVFMSLFALQYVPPTARSNDENDHSEITIEGLDAINNHISGIDLANGEEMVVHEDVVAPYSPNHYDEENIYYGPPYIPEISNGSHLLIPTQATLHQQWTKKERPVGIHDDTPDKRWNLTFVSAPVSTLPTPLPDPPPPSKLVEIVISKLHAVTAAVISAAYRPPPPEKPKPPEVPIADSSHLLKPTTALLSAARPKVEEKPTIHSTSFKSSPGNAKVRISTLVCMNLLKLQENFGFVASLHIT